MKLEFELLNLEPKYQEGKKSNWQNALKRILFCFHLFFVFDWGNHLQLDI